MNAAKGDKAIIVIPDNGERYLSMDGLFEVSN